MTIKSFFQRRVLQSFILFLCTVVMMVSEKTYADDFSSWCYARSVPYIDIVPSTEDIFFNFTKSEEELNNFKIDTVNPYGKEVIVDVGGLMEGGIEVKHNVNIGYVSNPIYNMTCFWYDKLRIDIGIKPTIYVAREYNKGTCMHNAIMEHEMKHIEVDRQIVNQYANKVGYEINAFLTQQTVFGPVPTSQLQEAQSQLTAHITKILKKHVDEMKELRRIEQQKVDTREEYDAVSAKCKRFGKKKR